MTPSKSADWKRVARHVKERRAELELTQTELAVRANVGTSTIQAIEGAKQGSYWPDNLRGIEAALGWQRGSIKGILAGGEPDETTDAAASSEPAETNSLDALMGLIRDTRASQQKMADDLVDVTARLDRLEAARLPARRRG